MQQWIRPRLNLTQSKAIVLNCTKRLIFLNYFYAHANHGTSGGKRLMGASIEKRTAAKHLAELLKEFAREEAKREHESLEKVRSAKIKELFGKHLEPSRAEGDGRDRAHTPKTHHLFLRIVILVARGPADGMSVRQIAQELGVEPIVVAACIGLHVHLERRRSQVVPLPLPKDYWVPTEDELITSADLEPPDLMNSPSRHS
jgi:hypothetical protein